MIDPIIGYGTFVDGTKRPIFEQLDGRQYVLNDDAEPHLRHLVHPETGGRDRPAGSCRRLKCE